MTPADQNPGARQGIICRDHGHQGISDQEYRRQLDRPDDLWKCPICGQAATWDDDRYEVHHL